MKETATTDPTAESPAIYTAPAIEVVEVAIEKGFACSPDPLEPPDGDDDGWM
jgi:hypothetical protein